MVEVAELDCRVLADGLTYPESPRYYNGLIYLSDVHAYQVLSVTLAGTVRAHRRLPGRPAGLGMLPDGRLAVATALDHRVVLLTAGPGGDEIHANLSPMVTGPLNDMIVDGAGRCWVGDTGHLLGQPSQPGRLIRVDPDGTATVVAEDVAFPNGLVLLPDGSRLLMAETFGRCITSFQVTASGDLAGRSVLCHLDGIPDGMCLDASGRVWVAMPELERLDVIDRDGVHVGSYTTPGWRAVACNFVGPDRSQLLVCLSQQDQSTRHGRLVVAHPGTRGAGVP